MAFGLVKITCMTAVHEVPWSNPTADSLCLFVTKLLRDRLLPVRVLDIISKSVYCMQSADISFTAVLDVIFHVLLRCHMPSALVFSESNPSSSVSHPCTLVTGCPIHCLAACLFSDFLFSSVFLSSAGLLRPVNSCLCVSVYANHGGINHYCYTRVF